MNLVIFDYCIQGWPNRELSTSGDRLGHACVFLSYHSRTHSRTQILTCTQDKINNRRSQVHLPSKIVFWLLSAKRLVSYRLLHIIQHQVCHGEQKALSVGGVVHNVQFRVFVKGIKQHSTRMRTCTHPFVRISRVTSRMEARSSH